MSVIVKTDRQKWIDAINNAKETAAYALAEQMLADSESFVPHSGGSSQSAGNLRESGTVVKGDTFNAYKFGYDDTIVTIYGDDYWHGQGDRKHVETWHFVKDEDTEEWSIEYH